MHFEGPRWPNMKAIWDQHNMGQKQRKQKMQLLVCSFAQMFDVNDFPFLDSILFHILPISHHCAVDLTACRVNKPSPLVTPHPQYHFRQGNPQELNQFNMVC